MRNKPGFAFTLEATLALLASVALIALLPATIAPPPSQDLYAFQLAQDLLEIGVKGNRQEIVRFAEGNAAAESALQSGYAATVAQLGRYCLVLRARENVLYAGCTPAGAPSFRRQVVGYRTLVDSRGNWFELEAVLKY
ncbi:MAG: hypothetical protein V1787_04420 [Candidatus Micrarchaeota archaeon]